MLRVGLDTSALTLTRAGTARYLTNVLDGLEADPELELRRYDWGGDGKATRVVRDTGWYRFTLPEPRSATASRCCTARRCGRRSARGCRSSVTIHDAAVLRHPDAFNRWTRTYSARSLPKVVRAADADRGRLRLHARRAGASSSTCRQSKIRVIPYGVGPPFTADGPAADGDYILAVSTLEPRKNLARLLEGFRRSGLDGLELRVVGAEGWGDVSVDGERVRRLTGVDDEELARLYRGAAAVAYVSLYEGFGLPVLEAMACARPVVAPAGPPVQRVRPRRRVRGRSARPGLDRGRPAPGGRGGKSSRGRTAGSRLQLGARRPRRTSTCTASSPGEAARRHRRGRARAPPHRRRDVRRGAAARARAARGSRSGSPRSLAARTSFRTASSRSTLPARSQSVRMAYGLPRLLRRLRPALAHFNYVVPPSYRGRSVVTVHDLSFERMPWLMGRRDRMLFRRFVPASARRADRVLAVSRAHEARPRGAVRDPRGQGRRHAERRRSRLPPERQRPAPGAVHALRRRDPAAEGSAGCDRGARAPRRRPRPRPRRRGEARRRGGAPDGAAARARAARRPRRATSSTRSSRRSTAAPPASSSRRATRASGCPCSRRWPPGRRSSPPRPEPCPRWPATRRSSSSPGDPEAIADGIRRALAERERLVAAGLERARQFSWAETARRTLAVYRELL